MPSRLLPCLALLGLLGLPAVAQPADEKAATTPGLVIRMQSLDELIGTAKFVAGLVGREEEAKQIEGLIKARAGEKGLEGIDMKRPFGAYATFGPNVIDSTAVLLVPITDEKAVLGLLENLNVKAEKGADDVYTIKAEGQPVSIYLRFAHRHAYVTAQNKEVLDKDKLLAPAAVLPAGLKDIVSVSLRIDQVPDGVRQLMTTQFEQAIANAKEQKAPNETETQRKLRETAVDEMARHITSVINDGGEIALRVRVDRQAGEMGIEVAMSGKPGSELAKNIAEMGKARSVVAGLVSPDSTMNLALNLPVPEAIRKAMGPVLDEGFAQALKQEQDKAKRDLAEKLIKSLGPSLKGLELDMAVDMRGPGKNKLYTMVAGGKVKDGAAVEQAVRDLVKALPEKEQKQITLDVEKAGDIAIHKIEIKTPDEDFQKSFGTGPAYLAVRSDAAFLAVGDNALGALKDALALQPKAGKLFELEMSLARFSAIMGKEQPAAPKAAEKAFGQGGKDKVSVTLEAGKELRLRLAMNTQVLQFFHLLEEANKGKLE
jgi:hypothetical protein